MCRHPFLVAFAIANILTAAAANNDGVINSIAELDYDENDHLSSHTLVYPFECSEAVEKVLSKGTVEGFKLHPVSGEAKLEFFPNGALLDDSNDAPKSAMQCNAICVERGVPSSLVSAAMPHRHFDGHMAFNKWFDENCRSMEVCFMNYHSRTPVKMNWVDHDGVEKPTLELEYGERKTKCIRSWLGHRFVFREGDTDEIVLDQAIEHILIKSIGESPEYTGKDRDFVKEIERTLNTEWTRHNRVHRTCSSLGFKKGRLPDDVFASTSAFYYNNRMNNAREEWSGKGVFVNWWEVDVSFIQIPWRLKDIWQKRLLDLVAAWTGTELEQTDMYGLRRYEEGARLLTHVDRETTHAFSLIVNVAQGNLSEPWPVEVHDHADRLHEVTMQPGDIVYYESAKCLHGRNKPLKGNGAYYVNLFTHYRPIGDPKWMNKPNPDGTPEPLIDVGKCKLDDGFSSADVGVGAAKCDNDKIGTYLSPTLFTATSGEDLFEWWKSVGPEIEITDEDHDEL